MIPTDLRLPCQIGASQPRNVVGEGLGWVEHSHPKSPNITEPHRLHFSGCTLPMFRTPRRARRPKQHQPAPRRPAHGQKGFAGPFHTKLWGEHDLGGTLPRFGSRLRWSGRAVWIGVRPCDRPGPGRRGAQRVVGGLGCSLMLAAFLAPCAIFFTFCSGILARPADFCSNILLECFCRGLSLPRPCADFLCSALVLSR